MTPEHPKKLFLLDAFALIYRAYYAFIKNPRMNSQGQNTSAAFGFTTALLDVINREKPTHIAVCFDTPEETNRSEEFSDYKANREAMPEDIAAMLGPIEEIIEAFNIPVLKVAGYEADDVVGTIAKKAEKEGFVTYMMTPDKDYAQLVSENIFMYKPARGGKPSEIWGIPEVQEKFEVERPEQVIDILGLWGDAVDNIPGIPGIGEKTSKKLVAQYGSVEGLIENAHELKGKQKENVIQFAEQGIMSKLLATIILDVPIEFEAEKLVLEEPNKDKIREVFTKLEFKTLARRVIGEEIILGKSVSAEGQLDLFGTGTPSIEAKAEAEMDGNLNTIVDKKVDYQIAISPEKRKQVLDLIMNEKSVCFDTETTGIDPLNAEIVGMSFSFKKGQAFWIPTPEAERQTIVDEFKPFFESETIEKIAHNIKYDIKIIKRYGVDVKGPLFDTMIAHYLITPESKHGMDFLAELYLKYVPISIETLIGKKGKNQGNMADLDPDKITDYACEDADITLQLKEIFEPEVNKDHLKHLFYEIEMPLAKVLAEMELEGIKLDVPALSKFSEELEVGINELTAQIHELADNQEFNIDSPRQLGEVLFDQLQIDPKAKKTKTGQYKTSEDVLSKLESKHEIIPLILNYRSLRKLKSTYVDALPALVNERTGHVHTSYMQTVAATGRLASNNPNLQNIPIRTEKGREIRKAFIARNEEFELLAADYSQIELRIIAALSNDENMISAFRDGHDIHAATAARVFGVENLEEVTRDQRSSAKAVNFGIIYGQSAFGLSQNLGISRKEAKEMIDNYFEQYSKIKSYMSDQVDFARKNGYVETLMKRRRYLKDINSSNGIVKGFAERNAVNAPIQGSAADVIKIAMINIQKAMSKKNMKSKMLLQVHDELVFDAHKSERDELEKLVKEKMETAVEMAVPLDIDYKFADNWLAAH
ncbi:MAG: DNA polymerase I [Crocinitomicaceae bacterium]|nr:DNA polymerase I [Crocinitomicaceae bacterium]